MKFKRKLTCSFFNLGVKEIYALKFLIKVRKFKLRLKSLIYKILFLIYTGLNV